MKTKSIAASSLRLFTLNKHIVSADGDVISVFSEESNWKLVNHFSLHDIIQYPSSVGVVSIRTSNDHGDTESIANETPSKKTKLDKKSRKSESVTETIIPYMCIGNQLGSFVFVSILNTKVTDGGKGVTQLKFDSASNKSPITCFTSNKFSLYFGHDNGLVGFIDVVNMDLKSNSKPAARIVAKSQYWTCHDTSLISVTLSHCGSFLLTGSSGLDLFLWDCKSRTVLSKLKPFATPVSFSMYLSSFAGGKPQSEGNSSTGSFVIASSTNSNYLTAWNWANNSTTNFTLSSNCRQMSATSCDPNNYLATICQPNSPLYISSCNVDGTLQLFSLNVNGKIAKSAYNVKILENGSQSIIPIVGCCFVSQCAVVFYGSYPNSVAVEELSLKKFQCDSEITLVRQDPRKFTAKLATKDISSATVDKMDVKKSIMSYSNVHLQEKPNESISGPAEPSLLDLLDKMTNPDGVDVPKTTTGSNSFKENSKSQAFLLVQLLGGNDITKLNRILSIRNEASVRETVRNLKGPDALKLITYILKQLDKSNMPSLYLWLQQLINMHFEYFRGCKSLKPHFDRIRQMAAQETSFFPKMQSLKSKLELTLMNDLRSSVTVNDIQNNSVVPLLYADEEESEGEPDSLSFYNISASGKGSFAGGKRKTDNNFLAEYTSEEDEALDEDAQSEKEGEGSDSDQSVAI